MKKLFTLLLFFLSIVLISSNPVLSQVPGNACATAVALTSPAIGATITTGAQTTCGRLNDFGTGFSSVSTLYGGGEDAVYSMVVPAGGGNYTFTFPASGATYKILSIHSACPPTTANTLGGFTTGTGTGGTWTGNLPAGTVFIIIDTWPLPNCGIFTLTIRRNTAYNPCTTIPTLSCGVTTNYSMTGSAGAWNTYGGPFGVPGQEKLFAFTPTVTGVHNVTVNASPGYVDLFWKAQSSGCNATGWTYVNDILGTETWGINLTAGVTYYLMLDDEDVIANTGTINIACPTLCSGTLVTLNMTDSWGDGWENAEMRLISSTGTVFGPYTLAGGFSGSTQICLPNGCYRIVLTAGTTPSEIGWSLTNGATTYASAASPNAAPFNTFFTIGGVSCPAAPSNDLCANAPIFDLGANPNQTHTGTGIGSTNTLGLTQYSQTWVRIVVPCGGMNVSMNFCGNTPVRNNAFLNLFSDCGTAPVLNTATNWNFTSCTNGSITLNWNNLVAGTYYYPILIDNIAWPGAYTLNISGTSLHIPATAPTSISVTTSGLSYTLTLQGGSAGTNGTVQWFEGSCGSTVQGTANSITVNPTTNTTYFVRYISSCNTTACISVPVDPIILPIDLIDFGAKYNSSEKNVKVEWLANVTHTDEHFVIQRTKDGVEFDSIGIIYPNEVGTNYFEFIDNSPYYNGVSYYRLKMIERDNYHFSNLSAIEVDGYNNEISLYPNPFNENIKVQNLGEYKGICSISIYDALGKLVLQKIIDFNLESKYEIDTKLLTSGFYTVEIKTDQITKSSKLRK